MFGFASAQVKNPLVSVCIPVFQTEAYLAQCIASVIAQDFADFEIVIVNDASDGTDKNGLSCKQIVQQSKKECAKLRKQKQLPPVPFTYIENRTNLQTVETRRLLIESARGEYIAMLDSDDALLPGALDALYAATNYNKDASQSFDIVHAQMQIYTQKAILPSALEKRLADINAQSSAPLFEREILASFLQNEHSGYLCAKCIRRDVYLRAFGHIPFTKCVMADDLLIYFFVALEAHRYVSIPYKAYQYIIDTGISSSRCISNLTQWEKVCSAANVFTVLYDEISRLPAGTLSESQMDSIRLRCQWYLQNNLRQLKASVSPELQSSARAMLCDYWGESFVEKMESAI